MPEYRDIEWGDLRFFLAVARSGKVTSAAVNLRVDPATVTRRIGRLEQRSGTILFQRRQTGYQLTDAGRRLLDASEAVETAVIAGQNTLNDQSDEVRGVVRIGAPDGFGSVYFAGIMRELLDRYPHLEIQLVATSRLLNLSKREADITIGLALPETGRVAARKLTDYKLGLYGSSSYVAANNVIESKADLPSHNFISYIDELLFSPELDYIRLVHSDIRSRFQSGNLIAQLNAVRSGFGLAVLPLFLISGISNLVRVLPQEIELERSFWLFTHEHDKHFQRNKVVADHIASCVVRDRSIFRGG